MRMLAKSVRALLFGGALALAVGTATPAQAAPNPYTPKEVCGATYNVIDQQAIDGAVIYLMWDGTRNCVTTIKTKNVGTPSYTQAILLVQNGGGGEDEGNYRYYAGPVKAPARGLCVRWGGATATDSYFSPWEHCG